MTDNRLRTLPGGFAEMLGEHAELAGLAEALSTTEPSVSVRVNAAKGATVPEGARRVAWCDEGFYLDERPAFTFDPALHQGLYYVQDASSMVFSLIARRLTAEGRAVRWLDACAAPGGKTTAVAASLPAGSLVTANEYDYKRAGALVENLNRWGADNVVTSRGDTSRLRRLEGFFDVAAVDAPCSGEGMMRKEEAAVSQWSPSLVRQCAALQREIVANVWEALRPGGVLVYSTCTFNTEENEGNLRWMTEELGAEPLDLGLADLPGVIGGVGTTLSCARFLPGRVDGEGLFVCAVRKGGDAPAAAVTARDLKALKGGAKVPENWLNGDYRMHQCKDGTLAALPASLAGAMLRIGGALDTVGMGIAAAVQKGKDTLPLHPLALAMALNDSAFGKAEVDYGTAMAFLRGEALRLEDAPTGIVLLTYRERALGFVKNLGNRANNLLPERWRVRSQHIPERAPGVIFQ